VGALPAEKMRGEAHRIGQHVMHGGQGRVVGNHPAVNAHAAVLAVDRLDPGGGEERGGSAGGAAHAGQLVVVAGAEARPLTEEEDGPRVQDLM
jgi:hypothetical protein